MSTGMGSWRMKPSSGAAGGRTNRFDGAGWASDGSRIQPGGYGNARPPQRPLGQPKPQNQADNPWNQGGTNQQQTRQPDLTQYMAPGSPFGRPASPRPPSSPAVPSPGQAQPQQSPYAGSSPYGQGQDGYIPKFTNPSTGLPYGQRPGQSGPAQQPSPAHQPVQGPPAFHQQPMIPPGGVGNWGNQMQGRPDPFYMDGMDPFGGWGGMDQILGQRAAFVNNINQHRGMTASQGLPPMPMNFNQMWNQAGQMQQQGWQNPLQGLFG